MTDNTPRYQGNISRDMQWDPEKEDLHKQCQELRHKIEDEHAGYEQKLRALQENTQKQTTLSTKLQNKVSESFIRIYF